MANKYVKIIDKERCIKTFYELIHGVPANETEWSKYHFSPQNGMVGEIVATSTYVVWNIVIVKIEDGIYVPMFPDGVTEISASDYFEGIKNISNAFNDFMRGANASGLLDAWVPDLPNLRQSFRTDVANNMRKLTCDWVRNVYMPDLEESCVMYAVDMALEYMKKSGISPIPQKILNQICEQVTDVYFDLFKNAFHEENKEFCIMEIKLLIQNPDARNIVDNYYSRVNEQYART